MRGRPFVLAVNLNGSIVNGVDDMNNDLISRSALVADIEDTVVISARNTISTEMRGVRKTIGRIEAAPAVDAVEVVRCGECIYRGSEAPIPGFAYCKLYKCAKDFDGYCDDGERGGNETDRR